MKPREEITDAELQSMFCVCLWAEAYVRAVDSGETGETSLAFLRGYLEEWRG